MLFTVCSITISSQREQSKGTVSHEGNHRQADCGTWSPLTIPLPLGIWGIIHNSPNCIPYPFYNYEDERIKRFKAPSDLCSTQRLVKMLSLDCMQWPNHPLTPTTLKRTNIHTRYLSAPLAIHLRGLTEEKEHEILAELDKVRINFERENVYCYHSLYSSIKPRKSELSSIFSPNNNVCSIYILIYTRNNISS